MSGFGRKISRRHMREIAKQHDTKVLAKQLDTLPQALSLIKSLSDNLNDAQKAIVQMLGEMDATDFEVRRQRAVFLRMHIDAMADRAPSIWTGRTWEGAATQITKDEHIQKMMEYEEQVRVEYDTMFALVAAFSARAVAAARCSAIFCT